MRSQAQCTAARPLGPRRSSRSCRPPLDHSAERRACRWRRRRRFEAVPISTIVSSDSQGLGNRTARMDRLTRKDLMHCLDSGEAGLTSLVEHMTGVLHARVARVRLRYHVSTSDLRGDVAELVQEVFVALFDSDALTLRNWNPERGLSFENYVGLVAERRAISILRQRYRNELPTAEGGQEAMADDLRDPGKIASSKAEDRELLRLLLGRLQQTLSPAGWRVFQLRFVEELELDEIQRKTGMSAEAIYASVSRLRRLARDLKQEIETSERPPVAVGGRS